MSSHYLRFCPAFRRVVREAPQICSEMVVFENTKMARGSRTSIVPHLAGYKDAGTQKVGHQRGALEAMAFVAEAFTPWRPGSVVLLRHLFAARLSVEQRVEPNPIQTVRSYADLFLESEQG